MSRIYDEAPLAELRERDVPHLSERRLEDYDNDVAHRCDIDDVDVQGLLQVPDTEAREVKRS